MAIVAGKHSYSRSPEVRAEQFWPFLTPWPPRVQLGGPTGYWIFRESGSLSLAPGDYVIEEPSGAVYPLPPELFARIYCAETPVSLKPGDSVVREPGGKVWVVEASE